MESLECLTGLRQTCIGDAIRTPSLCLAAICEGEGVGREESIDCRNMPAESALLLLLAGVLMPRALLCGVLK